MHLNVFFRTQLGFQVRVKYLLYAPYIVSGVFWVKVDLKDFSLKKKLRCFSGLTWFSDQHFNGPVRTSWLLVFSSDTPLSILGSHSTNFQVEFFLWNWTRYAFSLHNLFSLIVRSFFFKWGHVSCVAGETTKKLNKGPIKMGPRSSFSVSHFDGRLFFYIKRSFTHFY